jgi:hypothetical protein
MVFSPWFRIRAQGTSSPFRRQDLVAMSHLVASSDSPATPMVVSG